MQNFLPHQQLDALIQALKTAGYRCVGPQVRDGAIVYDDLVNASQLPWGMRDVQSASGYRLEPSDKAVAFGFSTGTQGLKPFLFKAKETVWKVVRDESGKLTFQAHQADEPPVAFFGARACDLKALAIQDQVFLSGDHPDSAYAKRRAELFLIAVNCRYSSSNCFCLSAGGSPKVNNDSDLIMTEVKNGFVVEVGSDRGQRILDNLTLKQAKTSQCLEGESHIQKAIDGQTKRIPYDNQSKLRDFLFNSLDHPQWEDVAQRCVSCGNCTSVCPTCFCHSEIEKPNMDGSGSSHDREWDSCFNAGHSYFAGKVLRNNVRTRYRQWLTHKVGSWFDQFGTSGCVGCGRCIAWCPTGIDLTEELAKMTGESNVRDDDDNA